MIGERLVNLVLSALMILLTIPFWVLISLAICMDSQGPVLFRQNRVGLHSKYFTIYKFRTMKWGTPDLPSELISGKDERFTRIGKILRRLSLDELPQLINIVKGDMSFVGPRPALYNQGALIEKRMELGIDMVRPGITGWAQVHGRDNISLETKVSLDHYYVQNKSWWLDVIIIYRTVITVFSGQGLYKSASVSDKKSGWNV